MNIFVEYVKCQPKYDLTYMFTILEEFKNMLLKKTAFQTDHF